MVLFDLNCLIMLIAYLSTSFCPWGMDTLVLELMLIYCCSVTKLCQALCDPMDCSTAGFPVLYHLPEFAQSHVHWVGDAIQPSHPLSPPSPLVFDLSQDQGLFQWVSSLHQVAKVLELLLQHQSFHWIMEYYWVIKKNEILSSATT